MEILVGFFLVFIMVLIAGIYVIRAKRIEQENRFIQSYIDSVQELYTVIQDRLEAVRMYRHDLVRHIQTLEKLISTENRETGALECVNELREGYDIFKKQEYSQDEIINSVLIIKKEQCREKKIPFEIMVEPFVPLKVQEADMAALLHNLLDNALEANERIAPGNKQGIRFAMGKENEMIWIEIENCIPPGEIVTFATWKDEKEAHGLGTKIIDGLIEKYHGWKEISTDHEKHLFKKKIFLLERF